MASLPGAISYFTDEEAVFTNATLPPDATTATSSSSNTISKPKSRAERLLRRTLPSKEWYRYMIKGYVLVRGSKGGLYQLTKGRAYGINCWTTKETICTVPEDIYNLDPADFIVAQYLSLLNDEKGFLKKANKASRYHGTSSENDNSTIENIERATQRMVGLAGLGAAGTRALGQQYAMTATEMAHRQQEEMYRYRTMELEYRARLQNLQPPIITGTYGS